MVIAKKKKKLDLDDSNFHLAMRLISGSTCPFSHRCRFVLHEKDMTDIFEISDYDLEKLPEDVVRLSPYGTTPILEDRGFCLYEANIINEYLDERFPHPQLMPPDPAARARSRLFMHDLERDIYDKIPLLQGSNKKLAEKTRQEVIDKLLVLTPVLEKYPYLMSESLTMLDVAIAPFLWRLQLYGIQLPMPQAKPLLDYAKRLFDRDAFQSALTPREKGMRKG